MLQLQQAVNESRKHLFAVFEEALNGSARLEGVELSDDMKFWLVTFSYWLGTIKQYKTVRIRSEDGVVLGIKNPDL